MYSRSALEQAWSDMYALPGGSAASAPPITSRFTIHSARHGIVNQESHLHVPSRQSQQDRDDISVESESLVSPDSGADSDSSSAYEDARDDTMRISGDMVIPRRDRRGRSSMSRKSVQFNPVLTYSRTPDDQQIDMLEAWHEVPRMLLRNVPRSIMRPSPNQSFYTDRGADVVPNTMIPVHTTRTLTARPSSRHAVPELSIPTLRRTAQSRQRRRDTSDIEDDERQSDDDRDVATVRSSRQPLSKTSKIRTPPFEAEPSTTPTLRRPSVNRVPTKTIRVNRAAAPSSYAQTASSSSSSQSDRQSSAVRYDRPRLSSPLQFSHDGTIVQPEPRKDDRRVHVQSRNNASIVESPAIQSHLEDDEILAARSSTRVHGQFDRRSRPSRRATQLVEPQDDDATAHLTLPNITSPNAQRSSTLLSRRSPHATRHPLASSPLSAPPTTFAPYEFSFTSFSDSPYSQTMRH